MSAKKKTKTEAATSQPAASPGGKAKATAKTAPTPAAQAKKMPAAKAKKLSALDAAARVLAETGQAMTCLELIAAMATKGYWTSPHGQTPSATLYSALLRETQTKGVASRFAKAERGKFGLRQPRG
jgi:hypothetical protein